MSDTTNLTLFGKVFRQVTLEHLTNIYTSVYGESIDKDTMSKLGTHQIGLLHRTRLRSTAAEGPKFVLTKDLVCSAWKDVPLEEIPKDTRWYKFLVMQHIFNNIPKEELRPVTQEMFPYVYELDAKKLYIRSNGELWDGGNAPFLHRCTVAPDGYVSISVRVGDKLSLRHLPIHRVVATAFIPIPECFAAQGLTREQLVVNHLDGNKHNNNVANLEWCTQCENNQHAHRTGLTPNRWADLPRAMPKY